MELSLGATLPPAQGRSPGSGTGWPGHRGEQDPEGPGSESSFQGGPGFSGTRLGPLTAPLARALWGTERESRAWLSWASLQPEKPREMPLIHTQGFSGIG